MPNDAHFKFAHFFQDSTLEPFLYLLSKQMAEGNICLLLEEEYLIGETSFLASEDDLAANPLVSFQGEKDKPFIVDQHRLYTQRNFLYETDFVQHILNVIENESIRYDDRAADLLGRIPTLQSLFPQSTRAFEDWQCAAAINAMLNDFTIITGGPGTGKTTTVAKLIFMLLTSNPQLRIGLAAPTGKASARMAESLRNVQLPDVPAIQSVIKALQPFTIHRLLGFQRNSIYFKYNETNPLPYDLLIIDEASMIDVALFTKLLRAVRKGARLILLGDKDQLASVEAGSLLGDLCSSLPTNNLYSAERVALMTKVMPHFSADKYTSSDSHPLINHVIALTKSHRFSDEQGIGKFSKAVINNDWEKVKSFLSNEDPQIEIVEKVSENPYLALYNNYIQEPDIIKALKAFDDFRILCAVREGDFGVVKMNRKVEEYLSAAHLIRINTEFYENRPIIVLKNSAELGLSNGDVGIIRKDEKGAKQAYFLTKDEAGNDAVKMILPGFIPAYETVFAMTIHKSQGSEFKTVYIELPDKENQLLTRELLYTAVTRAKSKVVLRATEGNLQSTCERKVSRISGVKERLTK